MIGDAEPGAVSGTAGRSEDVITRRRQPAAWPNAAQRAAALAASSAGVTSPVAPLTARPRIEDDPGLLGITRRSHSRIGTRLFNLFFLFVFVLIVAQMMVALLDG